MYDLGFQNGKLMLNEQYASQEEWKPYWTSKELGNYSNVWKP